MQLVSQYRSFQYNTMITLYNLPFVGTQVCGRTRSATNPSLLRNKTFISYFPKFYDFLCQLTCQSVDIMALLCGVDVHVRMSDFSDETTRPRDMLFFF